MTTAKPKNYRIDFKKLAATVARNARTYRTKTACALALHRVRKVWYMQGSYGNVADLRIEAVRACQDRWAELNGQEIDARHAALFAA